MKNSELLDLCNEYLSYDSQTGIFIWIKKPAHFIKVGSIAGSEHLGYCQIKLQYRLYKAHRLAYLIIHKKLPEFIDHINCIRDDNRADNLRACTRSQNAYSRPLFKNNKSGYKGVSWNKKENKWRAKITVNKKDMRLGTFTCKHEAADIYNKAAIKYHGDFAYLNEVTT